jgi:putative N-acetyltransferase (TIGR04045 family)
MSVTRSPSITPASQGAGACRAARDAGELARHYAVRRLVFVEEQRLFAVDDRDERDDDPRTVHAVGGAGEVVGGAVRLYPLDDRGLWKGDRLAVLPEHRRGMLGATLVRFAVRTAGERGGTRMVAMIQLPNVAFFEHLGWRMAGAVALYHGVEHRPMDILLAPGRRVSRRAR